MAKAPLSGWVLLAVSIVILAASICYSAYVMAQAMPAVPEAQEGPGRYQAFEGKQGLWVVDTVRGDVYHDTSVTLNGQRKWERHTFSEGRVVTP